MRRALLLLLAGLALASPAAAQKKIAVFESSVGGVTSQNYAATYRTLDRGGWAYTVFNAEIRTWGQAGVDDSVWFRQQGYEAVLIPWMDGQASGAPVAGTGWSSQFKNAAGTTGVRNSPLSGRWGILVVSQAPSRNMPSTASYDDLAGDYYVNGILNASPGGTFGVPAGGTWRCRYLCRLRGDAIDTLYTQAPQINGCRPSSWAGNGTVACIAWVESTYTGTCGDTAAAAWRYRPVAGGPGIYHMLFNSSFGNNVGTLMALQYIATLTSIRPALKPRIPLVEHDARPGLLNTVGDDNLQRLHDTLRVNNLRRWVATPTNNSETGLYRPAGLALLRREMAQGILRWFPFSYQWAWNFYSASDTVGARQSWNGILATATSADSFAFPRSAYDPRRIVTPSGDAGVRIGKVFADAGVKVIETTLLAPSAGGWAFLTGPSNYAGTTPYLLPDGSGRVLYAQQTIILAHDTSFTALRGGTAEYEYVGLWMLNFYQVTQMYGGLYWHSGGQNGPTRVDPYWCWLASVLARHFRFFDQVVEPDVGFVNQTFVPRRGS
jgi:hypothetical protein